MSAELNLQLGINFTKNAATIQRQLNAQFNVAGNNSLQLTRSVATSDVTLSIGSIGTVGYVYLHNLDATNFITFGSDGTNYPLKLKPGEFALMRWNAAAVHAKSDTAACLLEYVVVED